MARLVALARPSLRALSRLVLVQAPLVCLGPAPVAVVSLVLHAPGGALFLPSPRPPTIVLAPSQTYNAVFRVPYARDSSTLDREGEGEGGGEGEGEEMLLPTSMCPGFPSPDEDETRNCGMLGMIVVEFECNGERGNRFKSFHWNIHEDVAGIAASVFIVNNPSVRTPSLIRDIHDVVPGGCKFSARIRLYNTGDKDERVVLYMNKHCHFHHHTYHRLHHRLHDTPGCEGGERSEGKNVMEREEGEEGGDTSWPAIIPLVVKSPVITIPARDHTTFTCQYMSLRQGVLRLPDIEVRREVGEGETETLVNRLPITIHFSV